MIETYTQQTASHLTCQNVQLAGITVGHGQGSLIFAEEPYERLAPRNWVHIYVEGDSGLIWRSVFLIELDGTKFKANKTYTFKVVT